MCETNPPGPLINRLKWFCWKICFRWDIRTAQSQTRRLTLCRIKEIFLAFENLHLQGIYSKVHMLIFQNIFCHFSKIQNWLKIHCAGSKFSNLKFEYLRENGFFCRTILTRFLGAQGGLIRGKKYLATAFLSSKLYK